MLAFFEFIGDLLEDILSETNSENATVIIVGLKRNVFGWKKIDLKLISFMNFMEVLQLNFQSIAHNTSSLSRIKHHQLTPVLSSIKTTISIAPKHPV